LVNCMSTRFGGRNKFNLECKDKKVAHSFAKNLVPMRNICFKPSLFDLCNTTIPPTSNLRPFLSA
jgi:hypothetical protein